MQNMPKGPFPFKGKGENRDWRMKTLRARVNYLQTELEMVVETMYGLIGEYDRTFAGKLTAYLVFHRTASGNYIRWRMNGVKQRYFAIANDEIGEAFLQTQSATVQKVLLDFEQHRIRLNLLHGLCLYESKSLEKLIENTRRVNKLAREA
ncbi:MAG: hypothetical protein COB33_005615 [Thiotrichaceae bacterium]|nr:hypothetical protein [Thiotrichaceae bacterium]